MVVRKGKKSRKLQGRTRTMGWGRVGQHRKSGSRGGFGAVGFHKHKYIWIIKHAPNWYGKHGFRPRGRIPERRTVNVGELNELAGRLVLEGRAVIEDGLIVVDTVGMGVDKVLGFGKVTRRMKIVAREVTDEARRKIEEAGGKVILVEEQALKESE
ncbi:uL15 family ribosomal protein [Desulfurococcus mucosus]|uniref:Large ribosomal subunit protein uL15 n=1 Tax=Desulfurococcus mucosus (strain ATCC 35584 / DSM 2162 / JCM 9187 / O7/1) TaxID=765177 RepID=E8RAL8_DESM0|nr:uL15 family ribosomal protein [Desulfurococcus mucosus]ADV65454.1 LSU ribosomal protein L15P [Desulfurococcus mucosus DSM 2162]